MGLLEQLLGAAVQGGRGATGRSVDAGGSPLLAIILQLLTSGGRGTFGSAGGGARGADPLGSILGGLAGGRPGMGGGRGADPLSAILGGLAGGGGAGGRPVAPSGGDMLSQIAGALLGGGQRDAGLGGLLSRFQQAGLGAQADSWVGRGENMPLSPEQLERVYGREQLEGLAAQHGMNVDDMLQGLSRELPGAVDSLTPKGQVPDQDDLAATIGQLLGGGRR